MAENLSEHLGQFFFAIQSIHSQNSSLLHLFSFLRTYKIGLHLLNNFESIPIISMLEPLLILSLIASGILSILRKKASLIIYYIQMPLRFGFMIVSFGFILKLSGLEYNSIGYKILVGLALLLELARLAITILIHRKQFKNKAST